ncbi:tripartite motif-containing protein 2-like [Montipora capricornis]|uniref:tripartite motif-containing protein 2-like n=1 Tax=Montipora foliosa TaxID=591990 RepID=UPI0035F10E82
MAASHDHLFTDSHDYCCPVCLEEFQDPKVLPTCNHNVCRQCLEAIIMRSKPDFLRCPTCRRSSFIRLEDIDDLQTNEFLMKSMEQIEPQKERDKLSKGIQACVTKVEVLEEIVNELQLCRERKIDHGENLREKIHKTADDMVKKIRKSEMDLIEQLEDFTSRQNKIFSGVETRLASFSRKIQEQVDMSLKFIDEGNDSEMSKMKSTLANLAQDKPEENVHREVNELDSFTVNFEANKEVFEKVKNHGIGNLTMNDQSGVKVGLRTPLSVMRVSLHTLRKITPSTFGFETFSPLSVATDGYEHVAVADPENNNILILNRNGDFLRRFTVPADSSQPAMMFSGVAFSKDKKDLVAVNGALDVHIINPKEGQFKVSYRSSPQWGVKYCFVSTDPFGRLLLTCEPLTKQCRACIVVHSDVPFGKPELRFGFSGEGALLFPFKALYQDKHYYVTDMEKGCVMVYNEDGKFLWHFGRKNEEISGNGHLVLPTGMTFDPKEEVFYICDWGSGSIQTYKPDGTFLGAFPIDGRPTDIALLSDGNLVVTSKDDQWIQYVCFTPLGAWREDGTEKE